jgi:hypothetical protein
VPRTLPPERLPTSIPAAAFLRSAERYELERDQAELYIVEAVVDDRDSGFGRQCTYWLTCPSRWGNAERVLTLAANAYRVRQVAEIREALRRVKQIGPLRLSHRRSSSGHAAWALVSVTEADAQLELPGSEGSASPG